MAKTDPIDPNVPAGSEDPKLGDDRVRELARAVAEILNIDHYIGSDGGKGVGYNEDAAGEHKRVKFTAPLASDPANAANKFFIYSKDVSGKVEFFLEDEDGNVLQLTAAGQFNPAIFALLTGNQTIAGIKTFSSQPSLPAGLTMAAALISTLVTGTAPFTIASTTKVTNLNADKVDGYDVSAYSGGESYTFPGGMIIKKGVIAATSEGTKTVTFSTPFPTACDHAQATAKPASASPGDDWCAQVISYNTTTLTLYAQGIAAAPGSGDAISWLAIGR